MPGKNKFISFVFICVLLSIINGCGGGGGNQSPQPLITSTGTISQSGGNVQLSDGAKAAFTSSVVKDNTSIVVTKYASPLTPAGDAQASSSTYLVEIPADKIADTSGEASDLTQVVSFEIPVSTSITTKLMAKITSLSTDIPDDAYKLSRVVIDYGNDKLTLYGNYMVSGGKATVNVAKSTLLAVQQKANAATIKISTEILNTRDYFKDVQPGLYKINSSTDYARITTTENTNGKTPIILVHGWQMALDTNGKNPQITTWKNYIDYHNSVPSLKDNFNLYSFRYDSDHHIDDNAAELENTINQIFTSSQKIIIIAHSMGGLVSHSYIQKHNGSSRVSKLITLGTPYHGSPIVQALKGAISNIALLEGTALPVDPLLALGTPGTLDLMWDNFDNNSAITSNNQFLAGLNTNMNSADLYTAFAGNMQPDGSHSYYDELYKINKMLGYGYSGTSKDTGNDGVVPVTSALNKGYPVGFSVKDPEDNYDHGQIHDGKEAYNTEPLFVRIKQTLTSSSPIQALVGGAIQGKSLNLSTVVTSYAGSLVSSGSSNGTGSAARFFRPHGITTDGTNFYVGDSANNTIRKIVISTGEVTTIAGTAGVSGSNDGTGASASFNYPDAMTTDGTNLYVCDSSNNTIRKIVISTGAVTTIAGTAGVSGSSDGTGSIARFFRPHGITTDGTNLYVGDSANNTIRKIVISTREVTTIAGTAGASGSNDGTGASASFNYPDAMTTDGTNLYVCDSSNNTIRKIVISTGAVTTIAGTAGVSGSSGGTGSTARFFRPHGITTDGTNLYVGDSANNTIRKFVISTGEVTTIAGTAGESGSNNGTGASASFNYPDAMTTDGTNLYVCDSGNNTIRKVQ